MRPGKINLVARLGKLFVRVFRAAIPSTLPVGAERTEVQVQNLLYGFDPVFWDLVDQSFELIMSRHSSAAYGQSLHSK